jgi:hypothetical protein
MTESVNQLSEIMEGDISAFQRHTAPCKSVIDRQCLPLMPYESGDLDGETPAGALTMDILTEIDQSERLSFKGVKEHLSNYRRPSQIKGRMSLPSWPRQEEDDEDPCMGAERVSVDYSKPDRQHTFKGRRGKARSFAVSAAHSELEADCPWDILPPPSEQCPVSKGICKPKFPPQGPRFRRVGNIPGPAAAADVIKEMELEIETESKAAAGAGFAAVRCSKLGNNNNGASDCSLESCCGIPKPPAGGKTRDGRPERSALRAGTYRAAMPERHADRCNTRKLTFKVKKEHPSGSAGPEGCELECNQGALLTSAEPALESKCQSLSSAEVDFHVSGSWTRELFLSAGCPSA